MRLLILVILAGLAACSPPTEKAVSTTSAVNGPDALEGEYQIGDGAWTILPVKMAYEMRNAPGAEPVILFSQPSDIDSISVYANSDQTVILKMYPGHSRGMYYEPDEQWEVLRTALIEPAAEETEAGEPLAQTSNDEATTIETYLLYTGQYQLYTESEGASGTLQLRYLNDKRFEFEIKLDVPEVCSGNMKGEFILQQTDFGAYTAADCPLSLTLKGSWNGSMTVQIDQTGACQHLGDSCIFTGTYVRI